MRKSQRTIKSPITVSGVGLHTGESATLTLQPAEADAGVSFVRTDLPHRPHIRASADHIGKRQRRTTLEFGGAEVHTVEHLFAALSGLGIDNLRIEIDGPEVPGMDGSSLPFVEHIQRAGIQDLKAPRRQYRLDEPITIQNGDATLFALPSDSESLTIEYTLDYRNNGSTHLPLQRMSLEFTEDRFREMIAPARTFCLESESEQLRAAGLGKGANYDNTLVIADGKVIQNELRFQDEFVRHKILDLIGDLFLVGIDLHAHVYATRTGHQDNMELVRRITEKLHEKEVKGLIQKDSGLDINEICRILPHRYPFLLIDRVIEIDGHRRAVGLKNVTFNEAFFQGHWPGEPIMPGVLQIEAMAQLAGVLLLRKLENTEKTAVLLSIDRVKLRKAVVPGDQLRIEAETLKLKSRTGYVLARSKVNDRLVSEARMKFMLVDPMT